MKLLEEIPAFPQSERQLLESQYHITTAEALVEHATRNAAGLRAAMGIGADRFRELVALAEAHVPAGFVDRCRQPTTRHPRGVVIDP